MMHSEAYASETRFPLSHFTGKERDIESGNDYFGARYYASTMGRFLSPDWSAKVEPVPYVKLDNPQTLNLYQYMENNPLGGVDPDGHQEGFVITPEGPVPLAFPISGQLTRDDYNRMGNQVANFFAPLPGILKGDITHPIESFKSLFKSSDASTPKDVYIDPTQHPAAAGHAADAQAAGQPDVLTVQRPGKDDRRAEATAGTPTQPGLDRDEYPPAVTAEGGQGASVRLIPSSDNRGAGGSLGQQIKDVPDGGKIRIVPKPKPQG